MWAATALLIVILAVAGLAALQLATLGKVGDGVTVAGVSLQGLDRSAAAVAVASQVDERVGAVRLETGEAEPLVLSLQQLGISVDAEATARKAYAAGRRELPLGLGVWLPGGSTEVPPVVRVDTNAYAAGLEPVRALIDAPARDARLRFAGERFTVVPAEDGREVDAVALERDILAALAAGQGYAGPVPTKVVTPEVSTVDAEARASAAAIYLARPITLRYRSREVVLSPQQMAGMLSVNTGDDADVYPLTFRNDHARAELHRDRLRRDATVTRRPSRSNDDGTVPA